MLGRSGTRRTIAVLACIALFSLLHTINHDSLFGGDHHEEGDSSAAKIVLVLEVAGGLLGSVALALLFPSPRFGFGSRAVVSRPVGVDLEALGRPSARAGPGIPILLSVVRR